MGGSGQRAADLCRWAGGLGRRVAPALIFGVVLSLAMMGCKSGGAYNPEQDAKKMQGTWKVTGAFENGEKASGDATLTIRGDKYTMSANGVDEESTFTLGTGGPHTIRVFHHENPLASQGYYGGTLTGIYELSGDRLRICYDGTGRTYPQSFDASAGSHRLIFEFARE
jgi:uncharacterized protein (TIGR03067 family)